MAGSKPPGACDLGIAFIDAQLLTLCTHASLLAGWIETGGKTPDLGALDRLLSSKHSDPGRHPHSEDGTPTKSRPQPFSMSWPEFGDPSQRMAFALRVPNTNAILAVAHFFDVHRMSSSRTPEVQFLMRLRDAAVNANTFRIASDEYLPLAAYEGLVVDDKLDGTQLFGDGVKRGFMELGDTVGLLRYLANLLNSMRTAISAGDAG